MEENTQEKKETKKEQPYSKSEGIHPTGLGPTSVVLIIVFAFALTSAFPVVKNFIFGEDEYGLDSDDPTFIPLRLDGYSYLGTEDGQVKLMHIATMRETALPADRCSYQSSDSDSVTILFVGTGDEIRAMLRSMKFGIEDVHDRRT